MVPETCPAIARRLSVGAEPQSDRGVHFRLWAPRRKRVSVVFERQRVGAPLAFPLQREDGGFFSGLIAEAKPGMRYGFALDDDPRSYPDPVSRHQPDGPHELSEIVDPAVYAWRDHAWRGLTLKGQVFYEMHIGTFTPEGTWRAAAEELPRLAELGITAVEMMPVAEFAGTFGWGYDGVGLYAPTRLYGTPEDLRRFVDRAHELGLGVILDVVYNHLGPTGNYLGQYSDDYFSSRHRTDWGDGINFDGENSGPVREFYTSNAGYWIDEFHFDGLRLDAVHAIVDDSAEHIVNAVARRVRAAARGRSTVVVAEDEFQDARRLSHGGGGENLDAAWNDDFHHAARVAMTGHNEYYFGDYRGTPQELTSAAKWGYLYQGQWNVRQKKFRGFPALDVDGSRFVIFLQNHDQVGSTPQGRRLHDLTSPGRHRALTALLLLAPGTPLIFMGQEFASSRPFLFFADHEPELGAQVRAGRLAEMRQFRRLAGPDADVYFADPSDPATFEQSKLDLSEAQRHSPVVELHRDLLHLRREDPVFAAQRSDRVHGAVLADEAFLLRYLGEAGDDRLLLVNLGRDRDLRPATEPLLAPPAARQWRLLWTSEDPRYGGAGCGLLDSQAWYIPGHAAVVLSADTPGQ